MIILIKGRIVFKFSIEQIAVKVYIKGCQYPLHDLYGYGISMNQ